ncbi:MAG: tandem-95 repeat protein, partial [Gammaproteobacteria bacterium]|nr:tandem-95 repeat protein [Gammaproteobacteria bacterium]
APSTPDNAALLSMLSVTPTPVGNGASTGLMTWTFDSVAQAFDYLAVAEQLVLTYTIEVTDSHGLTATQAVTVTINGSNDVPTISAAVISATTEDDAPYSVDLLAGADDVDLSDILSATGLTLNSGNGAGVTANGNALDVDPSVYEYLSSGQSEILEYSYTIDDGNGGTVAQTATVTVTGANDAPVPVADNDATTENQSIIIDVLANDTDPDGDDNPTNFVLGAVVITSVTGLTEAAVGTATIFENKLLFEPGADYDELDAGDTATVTITYHMSDNDGLTASGTATITVTGVADGPVALNDTGLSTTENQAITVDVLANDFDRDGDDDPSNFILVSAVIESASGLPGPGMGAVSIVGNQLVFDPGTDFDVLDSTDSSTVSISYVMRDVLGTTSSATATIVVSGENDAPSAAPDTGSGAEHATVTIDVLANDTDVDGADIPSNFTLDSVSITSVVGIVAGTGGSVSINASDELVFDPGSDFEELLNGETATVTVAYTMSDDEGSSSSSTATITVTGVTNSAPVAVADGADSTENQIITVDVLSNDTDPDV